MKSLKSLFISLMPDIWYIKYQYYKHFKRLPNLKAPKSFTEKIQWLKLYNRNPLYTTLVDKFSVRAYVASKIGEEYLIPLLGVWDSPDEINFNELPDKFVLKTTHDSGGVFICKNKSQLNVADLKTRIKDRLSLRVFPVTREWPYKNVTPKVICEKFMTNGIDRDLTDYKWYCFNGEPIFCQVIRDRSNDETIDFFDKNWDHQEFIGLSANCHFSHINIPKPKNLEKMVKIARELSNGIPFVRVDLYEINNQEFFGELTFFPASGFGHFQPEEWDYILGQYIDIKQITPPHYRIQDKR